LDGDNKQRTHAPRKRLQNRRVRGGGGDEFANPPAEKDRAGDMQKPEASEVRPASAAPSAWSQTTALKDADADGLQCHVRPDVVPDPATITAKCDRKCPPDAKRSLGVKAAERPLEADIDVKSQIGQGGCGRAYLATRKETGAQCVVKKVRKDGRSEDQLLALQREVEVHMSLDHPLVAKLEDVYETSMYVQLVLEPLKGGELFDRICDRGRLSEDEAAGLVKQLLIATAHLHANSVIHGDLKPENAVFERKGGDVLKLIDFGLSRRWDQNEPISGLLGSHGYMAPEVFSGRCTDKVDVWSIGISTYVMLCGGIPWRGAEEQVRRDMIAGTPHFQESKWNPLSSEAKDFIMQLLQKDPSARLSAADALNHPWLQSHSSSLDVLETLQASEEKQLDVHNCCERCASSGLQSEASTHLLTSCDGSLSEVSLSLA